MAKQCPKPKRKRDAMGFQEKVLLVEAQANGQILHEEELEFLADPDSLAEVNNHDNVDKNLMNQVVQAMPYSEQLSVVNNLETEITSDSNIIPYSHVNDTLTAELEKYKEQVKVLKKGQNVNLEINDIISDSSAQSIEIDRLKQTLLEHLKEKEYLMQMVTLLKNDFKKEESRKIDRKIALEKKIKHLDNIVFKRVQSAQTVHMLTKPQFFYDQTTKQALGFQNPFYLKKAQQLEPKLYDGDVIKNTSAIVIPDSKETLMPAEESRSKILLKQQDPMMLEKKVNTAPVDYANYVNSSDHTPSNRPTKVEVPKELPKSAWNSSVDNDSVNVHEYKKCLKLKTKLLNKKDFIEKETYNKLFRSFTTLEKHCISLEVDSQLNQEIFQRDNSISNQSAPSFDQYFELNELKAQSQEKDKVIKKLKERIISPSENMNEDKIKKDIEEIETINIELDHRVSKLIAENEHLKQTYKQLYDSIKPARIRSKEQCDGLINQVNLKSVDKLLIKSILQKRFVNYTLKDDLRKLKGKALVNNAVTKNTIDPEMLKIDVEPITPKLLNKIIAHFWLSPQRTRTKELDSLSQSHPQKPKNNPPSIKSLVANKPMSSSTGVRPSTSASGSQPSGNNKKNKIQRPSSSTLNNKVEAHPRTVKSSLKHNNCVVKPKETINVHHSKINANSQLLCVKCNGCMLSANHDLCVLDFINNVNARAESKSVKKSSKRKVWKPIGKVFTNIGYSWRPTGRTFTIVGNACPLTRITTTAEVPLRKPTALECDTSNPQGNLGNPKLMFPLANLRLLNLYQLTKRNLINLRDPYENLGKLQPKADIGIFIGYAPTKKAFRIYNRRTRRIIETIHVDFDELTAMASEHNSLGPALHEMTPATISSGLVPNPSPLTPFVPPSRTDWDILFQLMFDELLIPPPSVDLPAPEVIAPIDEVVALVPAVSTGSPSSTIVDQDAPSPSNSQTTPKTQPPVIPNDVEEDNHDIEVAWCI
ncbi:hypothetical protein Tco_0935244 [Tanacetum coccineum]